ncbi:MAG: hypothetical protein KGL67_02970 [Patescibacteria group bacterium]|nr:hypothetical protein [Patescibacteria group bacterium]
MKKHNRGFIGILMLLIGVAIVAFIIVRTGLFTNFPTGQGSNNNMMNGGFGDINAARNARNLIEQDNQRAIQQLK